jgi:hypothetical protein
MKKLLSVLVMAFATLIANAQSYEPNTKWPYIYENFTDGTIFFDGNKKKECKHKSVKNTHNVKIQN